jgi:hypothetical protein
LPGRLFFKEKIMKVQASIVAALAVASIVAACRPAVAPPTPVQSIQELMATVVDPSADAVWEAVSTEVTAAGIIERAPVSAEEWQAVRRNAAALADAARLLEAEHRPVAPAGKVLEDAHVAGILKAEEIEARIAATGPQFKERAQELGKFAQEALAAIDARDTARLVAAGGRIDQACERCHSVYWYPNAAQPSAKWPAALKRN